MLLKYLNCLHELDVTAAAASAVGEQLNQLPNYNNNIFVVFRITTQTFGLWWKNTKLF